ncbi:MAG: hypothetical protein JWN61_1564 [Pseudonocardiales bacterium]|nr:hypothetical protein [Jatrophihabitantaceae bacterium]MCW2603429.1 hypothetical protein [Pseudonocardiales bacterium]
MTDRKLVHGARPRPEPDHHVDASVSHTSAPFRSPFATAAPVLRSGAGGIDLLGGTEAAPEVSSLLRRRRGQGQALPEKAAQRFGEAYGSDLSAVRVHTDGESDHIARSVQATAFTHGTDVYFSSGTYSPGSASGEHLLAHELAHVVQHQKGEFGPAGGGTTIGRAHDPAEGAADRMASGALSTIRRAFEPGVAKPAGLTRSGRGGALFPGLTRSGRGGVLANPDGDSLANHRVAGGDFKGTPGGKFSMASDEDKRKEVKETKAGETKKELHQPVADLGEIYAHNEMLNAEFQHQVKQIAIVTIGMPEFRPGGAMKSIGRTMQKIVADYKGDTSRIVDITGGSIYFDSATDLIRGFGAVRSNPMWKVVRIKNSLAKGKSYGDINMSLEMGGADYEVEVDGKKTMEHHAGFIVELQLHLTPIIAAKAKGHKQYEAQRDIEAKHAKQIAPEGTKREDHSHWDDPKDAAKWQSLEDQMMAIYTPAWDKIGEDAAKFKAILEMKPK